MKKYLVICIILCTFLLVACQVKNSGKSAKPKQLEPVYLEKAKTLEIGITYKIGDSKDSNASYIKFVDNQHYVYMKDYSHDTQEEIDDINREGDGFYPYVLFTEGQYTKDGDNLNLTPTKTMDVEFKNPEHVKDKIIASKRLDEGANAGRILILTKKDGAYAENNQENYFTLYKVNKAIPDSIEDFLKQYEYQPEKLPR
ncbi:Uncharacterised protein [Streptococcus criceti]|uniref:Lipoprotein n=1 Tax=Streptococcus criceti HS-6 TaxID=873449 RepID=G5JRN3_STRCG|nr:hypothetical protein [Streptococcus criceti]EHI73707.1 putative lipoprotein [Streptococcus criceti HS-6]SUN42876.1 Uncharacterised protein [Streptococcus criceti]